MVSSGSQMPTRDVLRVRHVPRLPPRCRNAAAVTLAGATCQRFHASQPSGLGSFDITRSLHRHSRPCNVAVYSASSPGAAAGASAYTWPWLPAPKPGLAAEHAKTQLAWLVSLLTGVSTVIPLLATIAYIHLNEASLTAALGSRLQTLFLLAWPVLYLAAYMPAFVQHEYEGHQAAEFDSGTAVDRSTHLNAHLHILHPAPSPQSCPSPCWLSVQQYSAPQTWSLPRQ